MRAPQSTDAQTPRSPPQHVVFKEERQGPAAAARRCKSHPASNTIQLFSGDPRYITKDRRDYDMADPRPSGDYALATARESTVCVRFHSIVYHAATGRWQCVRHGGSAQVTGLACMHTTVRSSAAAVLQHIRHGRSAQVERSDLRAGQSATLRGAPRTIAAMAQAPQASQSVTRDPRFAADSIHKLSNSSVRCADKHISWTPAA